MSKGQVDVIHMNEGVVSKETVVLRRWGSSIQKFGFINGVDNVNWPPSRGGDSHMKQTGMLVGNFEFNP